LWCEALHSAAHPSAAILYVSDRLEAACLRRLEIGARSYGSVQSILRHGLDRQSNPTPARAAARLGELPLIHPNIRGSDYYA
jgi:hypothetical protein